MPRRVVWLGWILDWASPGYGRRATRERKTSALIFVYNGLSMSGISAYPAFFGEDAPAFRLWDVICWIGHDTFSPPIGLLTRITLVKNI
jgi:hypothetical protein